MRIGVNRRAEELEALLEGREGTDGADRELRALASLATRVQEEQPGPTLTLSEDARTAMRSRLMADIAELEAPVTERVAAAARPGLRRAATSARAALATGVASAMIGSAGVAMAAQEAVPGDALYNLKKGTETVRMSLAGDTTQAARLELRFAEERLEEVIAGIDRNPNATLIAGLREMDERSLRGAERLVEIAERRGEDELLAELDQFVHSQSETLVEVFGRLPVEVRPFAEDSLSVLRQIRGEILGPVAASCDCDDVTAAGEVCDCGAELLRRISSDPLPRAPRGAQIDVDPATADRSVPSTGGEDGGEDTLRDVTSTRTGGTTADSGDLVPELPGPLNDVGRTVNDTVDKTTDTVRDTVDRTTDTVDDTVDKTTDTLEETTDSAGDLLKDTTDAVDEGVGGLLGDE
jgi:hypothetical protein